MKLLKWLLIIGTLILGLFLRIHNYEFYPQRGASSDEYTYSFLGVSLWTTHIPTSWSYFPPYQHRHGITINHIFFPIVYPYFDHPPLNGLLVGGWAILNGQTSFEKIDLRTIRLVPIFLALISSLLLFLIAKKMYGFTIAFWALLIYSVGTLFVMNGRVVFAENLLTPLLLGSIYLFIKTYKRMSVKSTIVLGVLSGLSFWTKELGIITYLSLVFLFFIEKMRVRYIVLLSAISLVFVLLYIAYGTYYDAHVFWSIIVLQSGRVIGPETLLLLLTKPIIVNKVYFDGWYMLGLIAMFFCLKDYKKHAAILTPAFLYFFLLLFSITKDGEMGWYMIPLFPFFALCTSLLLAEAQEKGSWLMFVILSFVGFYETQYLFEANFGLTTMQFRVLLLLLFGPFLLVTILAKERLFRWLSLFYFYALIGGTILLTYFYIHPA